MIERSDKDIGVHGHPPSPCQLRGYGASGWAAAIFVLSVLPAIPWVPHAFAQPGTGGNNQTKESLLSVTRPPLKHSSGQQTTKGGQPEILPYDIRPKLPSSQLSRGFHTSKDLIPRGIGIS